MIKEGRSQGRRVEYKQWIKIQDISLLEGVTKLKEIKTRRQHELFSDMETSDFYILEYTENVIYIRGGIFCYR